MATYDLTNGKYGSFDKMSSRKRYDFANLYDNTGAKVAVKAGDILKLINIPKGLQINTIRMDILTAVPDGVTSTSGAVKIDATANLGDDTSAARYFAAVPLAATGVKWGDAGVGGTWGSRVAYEYEAEGYLKLTALNDLDSGVIVLQFDTTSWDTGLMEQSR